jgi:hypothetical protein
MLGLVGLHGERPNCVIGKGNRQRSEGQMSMPRTRISRPSQAALSSGIG